MSLNRTLKLYWFDHSHSDYSNAELWSWNQPSVVPVTLFIGSVLSRRYIEPCRQGLAKGYV